MTTQKEIVEDAAGGLGKRSKISPQNRSDYIVLASRVIAAARVQHEAWGACKELMRAMKALDGEIPND